RSMATRRRAEERTDEGSQVAKPPPTSTKPLAKSERPELARRDVVRRPTTDLLEDSLFDEKPPETRTGSRPVAKPTIAKASSVDENPFKHAIVRPLSKQLTDDEVATADFDDLEDPDDLDDERNEETEELELSPQPTVRGAASVTETA